MQICTFTITITQVKTRCVSVAIAHAGDSTRSVWMQHRAMAGKHACVATRSSCWMLLVSGGFDVEAAAR